MLVSVFTPSHDPHFLNDCLDSLLDQTHEDWEWVVYLNGGRTTPTWRPPTWDPRVVVVDGVEVSGVGEAKRRAVQETHGEILVELDHDDVLTSDALEKVVAKFQAHPDAGLVYSHFAQIGESGQPLDTVFTEGYGWEYATTIKDLVEHQHVISMQPTPHNVSLIWHAPNHLRAFTRAAYDTVGGYDDQRDILDDQDLMARLYRFGDFRLIDDVLYLQRSHSANTQIDPVLNERIQVETVQMYDGTIEGAALAWAEREGLTCLDLGGAHGASDMRYLRVDQHAGPGVQIEHTFPARLDGVATSSVGVIRAVDFLEHVVDKVAMINEIYRMLAPGGLLLSRTPSTDGRGAFQDPTHVAFYNENSFWYYVNPSYRCYVPEIQAKFQVSRLITHYPTEWHQEHHIPYVAANLIAIKPGTPRQGGPLNW